MTDWKEVRDSRTEEPAGLDTTSSATTVYERRNIRRESREETIGEDARTVTEWVYEQREYTREEYAGIESPSVKMIMQALSDIELSMAELSI